MRCMSKQRILKEATIAPNAIPYRLLGIKIALSITIIGIPLLLIFVPITKWYWSRYYKNLKVILTTRDLLVHRGIFNREEKSIPLEKITDLAVFQGPIMRHMNVKGIRLETAGQSSGMGALVQIIGIFETDDFRDMVLTQRDRITEREAEEAPAAAASAASPPHGDAAMLAAIEDIRDTLRRIEAGMAASERH
jgi:putative membrane protein